MGRRVFVAVKVKPAAPLQAVAGTALCTRFTLQGVREFVRAAIPLGGAIETSQRVWIGESTLPWDTRDNLID